MTTADFIKNTYGVPSTRDRHCSSVFTDRNGNVYSYGYHYPLAFKIDGLNFINVAGYSSTTAKHIAWAKWAIGYYNYIPVKLQGERLQYGLTLDKIKVLLEAELSEIHLQMYSKTRHDTAVYRHLMEQEDRVMTDINKVVEVLV